MTLSVTLPKPPSINHIYGYTSSGGHARSYVTAAGKAWFEAAGWILKQKYQSKVPIESKVFLTIMLYTARRQDIDNVLKPLLDALQKSGVLDNDNLVYKIDIEKRKTAVTHERVELQITEYQIPT